MSDPVTALGNLVQNGPVSVAESGPHGMLTLRGDLSDAAIAAAVQGATGLPVPAPRRISQEGARRVIWFSPDEALIVLDRADLRAVQDDLTTRLGTAHALVADMSDARAMFRLSGPQDHLGEVIARLCPVDMTRFEVGEVRRTRLAQIAAALWMIEPGVVDLVCFRSVARYAYDILAEAASGPRIG